MILSLEELSSEPIGGSKAWNLSKVLSSGARIPKTLVIPSTEISGIMIDSGVRHDVFELSRSLIAWELDENLLRKESLLKSKILSLRFPEGLIRELMSRLRTGVSDLLIVRPSPFYPELSEGDLKGRMQVWYCKLDEKELQRALLKVLSESFNLRTIARLIDLGVYPEDLSLALIVQEAIIPRSSGVALCYPAGRSEVLIKSTWGSIDGVPVDKFRIGIDLGELIESEINEKKTKLVPTDHGLKEVEVESDLWIMPSLSKDEVREIASVSLDLSLIFGIPTAVEWMIQEGTNLMYVIQAYRESGKPKMKALEKKIIDLIERRIAERPAAKEVVEVPSRDIGIPLKVKFNEEFPLLGSRIYMRKLAKLISFDGSLLRQEEVKKDPESCGNSMLLIEESEELDGEILRKCSKIVVRSRDIVSAVEIAEKVSSLAPGAELVIYSYDLSSSVLNNRISDLYGGILIPLTALSGADLGTLGQLLRIIRSKFRSIGVDLLDELPDVDIISSLIKIGIDYFVLSEDLALNQAKIISRAEKRILLDFIKSKMSGG